MDVPPILTQVNPPPPPQPPGKPKPHGCLITWLLLMLLFEGLSIFAGSGGSSSSAMPSLGILAPPPSWYSHALQVLSGIDIFCVVFLFMRKKWAFYGSAGVGVCVLVLGIIAGRALDGSTALILPAVLYGILQIGGENSGWKQLK